MLNSYCRFSSIGFFRPAICLQRLSLQPTTFQWPVGEGIGTYDGGMQTQKHHTQHQKSPCGVTTATSIPFQTTWKCILTLYLPLHPQFALPYHSLLGETMLSTIWHRRTYRHFVERSTMRHILGTRHRVSVPLSSRPRTMWLLKIKGSR